MTVRYEVEDVFSLTGRGPTTVGVLTRGRIDRGAVLQVEATGEQVRVRSFDLHTREVPGGQQVQLQLDPADAAKVGPGAVLVSPGP